MTRSRNHKHLRPHAHTYNGYNGEASCPCSSCGVYAAHISITLHGAQLDLCASCVERMQVTLDSAWATLTDAHAEAQRADYCRSCGEGPDQGEAVNRGELDVHGICGSCAYDRVDANNCGEYAAQGA